MRRRGKLEVNVTTKALPPGEDGGPAKPKKPPHPLEKALDLGRFASASRIKVYRETADDPQSYVGQLPATDDTIANLEEILAGKWGGGKYAVKGFDGGACIAGVTLSIDRAAFAPKEKE